MPDDATNLPARAPIAAGGALRPIVPHSFEEAYRLATALAASGLTPKGIDSPEKCLVVIMAGAEIGMTPFTALQSFAVVNGRPTLWGDGVVALVRARGFRIEESLEGSVEHGTAVAVCTLHRTDTGERIERRFTVADAKRAGLWTKEGPWRQYPQRMLQMRARAWALRDGAADVLRGIGIAEEERDVVVDRSASQAIAADVARPALPSPEQNAGDAAQGADTPAAERDPSAADAAGVASPAADTVTLASEIDTPEKARAWALLYKGLLALARTKATADKQHRGVIKSGQWAQIERVAPDVYAELVAVQAETEGRLP